MARGKTRLQKYIAQSGVLSRRKAEDFIKQGKIEVNGKIVTEPWFPVDKNDCIKIDGDNIIPENKRVYIMLNKPEGYISTVKEQFSRKTVIDLIKGVKERIYPVGRLDYNTSGLLLLTNDGDFTYKLTHPKYEVPKIYIAEIQGIPTKREIIEFEKGIYLKEDNFRTSPAKMKILNKKTRSLTVEIAIYEGRNRQIRKMCQAIGHPVINLKRITIGTLTLGKLPEGRWRYLTKSEVKSLSEIATSRS